MKKPLDLEQLENVSGGVVPAVYAAGFLIGMVAAAVTGDTRQE